MEEKSTESFFNSAKTYSYFCYAIIYDMSLNGWVLLDKQNGITSMQAVRDIMRKIRKQYAGKKIKIGHGGTLDPFATGILPIALGEATKLLQLFMHVNKAYVFKMVFGQKKDTGDITGKIIHQDDMSNAAYSKLTQEALNEVLQHFHGMIEQVPHKMSAIHINGKRAYDLFRNGEKYELSSRKVCIEQVHLLDFVKKNDAKKVFNQEVSLQDNSNAQNMQKDININFDHENIEAILYVRCGKGVYIRSLCEDIAKALNTHAYVAELNRVEYGRLCLKSSYNNILHYTTAIKQSTIDISQQTNDILDMNECIKWFDHIEVDMQHINALRHGSSIKYDHIDGVYLIISNKIIICIGEMRSGILYVSRVINYKEE